MCCFSSVLALLLLLGGIFRSTAGRRSSSVTGLSLRRRVNHIQELGNDKNKDHEGNDFFGNVVPRKNGFHALKKVVRLTASLFANAQEFIHLQNGAHKFLCNIWN
jgi:hypothetical protein